MTRENYERFLEEFRRTNMKGFQLYDFENTPNYYHPFLKLAKTDTWTNARETHRISIDIFAYDGCGDDLQQAHKYLQHTRKEMSSVMRNFHMAYVSGIIRIKYLVKCFPIAIFRYLFRYLPLKYNTQKRLKYLRSVYDKCNKYKVTDSKYSANIAWGLYGNGEVQPSESFINLTTMQFGERTLPVPSGWHEYLTGIYGDDYMTPLPIKKRHRHTKVSYKINTF